MTGDLFLGGDLNNKSATDIVRAAAFKNADVRVSNLEQPISNSADVAEKCTLHTGSYAVAQLEQLGISVVNLANNHIHDKGLAGIIETTEHLKNGRVNQFSDGEKLKDRA
ncbi:CapA family protein [Kordiimonas sp.]|uniref:CapA family protein n=1 Tax=Kordiimonas sp. TaxID=1970157 RepID=UPI003A9433D5